MSLHERVLSTKVGRVLKARADAPRDQNGYVDVLPFVQQWNYSAGGVRRSVEDSLQRLGIGHIDVAFVHDCDEVTHGTRYRTSLTKSSRKLSPRCDRCTTKASLDIADSV